MTVAVQTRRHFGLILAFVVLFGTFGFSTDTVRIHMARFGYSLKNCDNPSNPLVKLLRTTKDIAAATEFVGRNQGAECAQAVGAELKLVQDLEEYLQSQGIQTVAHPGQVKDVEKQLLTQDPNTNLILYCVITSDVSNKSQLNVVCSAIRLNGDPLCSKRWQRPNFSLEQIPNLFESKQLEEFFDFCERAREQARRQ